MKTVHRVLYINFVEISPKSFTNLKYSGGRTLRRKSSVINDPALLEGDTNSTHNQRLASLSAAYTNILNSIGEDSMRQGQLDIFFGTINIQYLTKVCPPSDLSYYTSCVAENCSLYGSQ